MSPSVTQRSDPADIAVAFARVLRGLGLRVPTSCTHSFAEALVAVGFGERSGAYWAGRATLVRRPEDIDIYNRAFAVFFDRRLANVDGEEEEPLSITIAVDAEDDEGDDDSPESSEANDDPTIELRFSATEVLRQKDFAEYTDDELADSQEILGDPPALNAADREGLGAVEPEARGARGCGRE